MACVFGMDGFVVDGFNCQAWLQDTRIITNTKAGVRKSLPIVQGRMGASKNSEFAQMQGAENEVSV
jgi:hypothetical protein